MYEFHRYRHRFNIVITFSVSIIFHKHDAHVIQLKIVWNSNVQTMISIDQMINDRNLDHTKKVMRPLIVHVVLCTIWNTLDFGIGVFLILRYPLDCIVPLSVLFTQLKQNKKLQPTLKWYYVSFILIHMCLGLNMRIAARNLNKFR